MEWSFRHWVQSLKTLKTGRLLCLELKGLVVVKSLSSVSLQILQIQRDFELVV